MKQRLLTRKEPEKNLLVRIKRSGGRNNQGRITLRFRGGGARKLYRQVTFNEEPFQAPGKVSAIEYDPNRNAFLMLVEYADGSKRYHLSPHGIVVGDSIVCDEKTEVKTGNRMKLKHIPLGTMVHNVELAPGGGGKIVRSAGTGARVDAQEGKFTHLALPSSEIRKVLNECFASIGTVSNPEFMYQIAGKAGSTRLKGRRPRQRGSAMNPADHPHGGGEGRASIGLKYPKTPWGKHALGVKTRGRKWQDTFIIQRRIKKKREK